MSSGPVPGEEFAPEINSLHILKVYDSLTYQTNAGGTARVQNEQIVSEFIKEARTNNKHHTLWAELRGQLPNISSKIFLFLPGTYHNLFLGK